MKQVASIRMIVPEKSNDFVHCIKINHNDKHPESKFYPSAEFAAYVAERMNEWLAESKAKIMLEKVNSIRVSTNQQLQLSWANQSKIFDAVHLCTGIFPYKDPYNLKIGRAHV